MVFRKMLTLLSPKNAMAHVNLGIALENKGDLGGAIVEYREALRLNPNNDDAHVNLGIALGEKGDWDGQLREGREALRLNPKNEDAHVALGVALGQKGDWDEGIAEFRELLRLNPKNGMAHVALGHGLGKNGDWDGAIAEYREALRLNPKNGDVHANLAFALGKKGDWDGMIAEERKVVVKNYSSVSDTEQIQLAFRKAVQLVFDEQFKGSTVPGPSFPVTGKVNGKRFRERITKVQDAMEALGCKPEYIRLLKSLCSLLEQGARLEATPTNLHLYENLLRLPAIPITPERAEAFEKLVADLGTCIEPIIQTPKSGKVTNSG